MMKNIQIIAKFQNYAVLKLKSCYFQYVAEFRT